MARINLVLGLHCVFCVCRAEDCPLTQQETDLATYVSQRSELLSGGHIAHQIKNGTYTPDSLSLELYAWWVQMGLANHRTAIDTFVSMILDAGLPQEHIAAKNWLPIVTLWIQPILMVAGMVSPAVIVGFQGIITGVTTYKTIAMACADPEEGGSTDFLKAARKWSTHLPEKQTSQLLMVHNFINDLKDNYTDDRLLGAYHAATLLINSTQSYRSVFNRYYSKYLEASTDKANGFHIMAYSKWHLMSAEESWDGVLWSSAPWTLNNCVIARSVLEENNECIDRSTPALGEMWQSPIVVHSPGVSALEYSCDNLNPRNYRGCWDSTLTYYPALAETCNTIYEAIIKEALATASYVKLQTLCKKSVGPTTKILAGNWGIHKGRAIPDLPRDFHQDDFVQKRECPSIAVKGKETHSAWQSAIVV